MHDEFFPLNTAKKEIQIFTKIINNFVKKSSQKYNIKPENIDLISISMNNLLASLYIISDLTTSYDAKNLYSKNLGWSLNNAYHNIFDIMKKSDDNFLLEDMHTITYAYSKIKFWNYNMMIPEEEEYKNTIKDKFPKIYFAKMLQNNSDRIDDEEYNKILNFIIKFIICRNYRDDYKYFFESYLKNYDAYTMNFVFLYLAKINYDKLDEIKNLFINVKDSKNKIKILEILNKDNIPDEIYKDLKILQNEIVVESKTLFNAKYMYRIIDDFNLENAINYHTNI